MRKVEYSFTEATPLIDFIETHKKDIIGKPIRKYRSIVSLGEMSEEPVIFEFDDFAIAVFYFVYSDLTIYVLDPKLACEEPELRLLYDGEMDFPYIGSKITDITLERFSDAFEINGSTGEIRPDGGDYFRAIIIHLEDGKQFYIRGEDALYDGYLSVWNDFT